MKTELELEVEQRELDAQKKEAEKEKKAAEDKERVIACIKEINEEIKCGLGYYHQEDDHESTNS